MSVCVLSQAHTDSWSARSTAAIGVAGSSASRTAAMPADARVILASSAVPLATIAATFATPLGQACRKIAVAEGNGATMPPLFDIADMLVFPAAGLAHMLGFARWPDDSSALAAVQGLLKRDNQAAVVRFPGNRATAIWADRTLDVTGPTGHEDDGTMARFGGTIAAAVDQRIGPEQALVMALAAAVSLSTPQAVR